MLNKMNSLQTKLNLAVNHEGQRIIESMIIKIYRNNWGQSINLNMRNPLRVILGNKILKNSEKTKTF